MEEKQSALFRETGSFFAFSKKQFDESMKDDVKYTSLGGGLICPSENAQKVVDGLEKIYVDSVQEDLKENGKENIIRRELYNHECFYTHDYQGVADGLSDYGITLDEVKKIFYIEAQKFNG